MLAGLQKLQVGDAAAICGKIVCGTSLFMFLPAGRDVVCPGGEIMPDDDKLLGKMFTDRTKEGYTFMWNQWGTNWIMLALMKILAVSTGSADFLKLGLAHDVATIGMMAKGWIPEFKPFLVLFGLEALAIGKLAFAK